MAFKKFSIAAVLAITILFGATGCDSINIGNRSGKKVKEEAQAFIDALQSLKAKDIRYYITDDDLIDEINLINDYDEVKDGITSILKTVEFDIVDDSIKTDKKSASIKVIYTYVDISKGDFDEIDEALDYIDDCIDDRDVVTDKFTLKFDIDDGEYFLSNGDDVVIEIFDEVLVELYSNYSVLKENLNGGLDDSSANAVDLDSDISFLDCTGYMDGNVYYNEHFNVAVDYGKIPAIVSEESGDDYIVDSSADDSDTGLSIKIMIGVFKDLDSEMSFEEKAVAMDLSDDDPEIVNIHGLEFIHAIRKDGNPDYTEEVYCLIDGKIVFVLHLGYDSDEGKAAADDLVSRIGLAKYPER